MKILVDTGSNKNFIHPKFTKIAHDLKKPFNVSSVGGNIKIDKYSEGKFFKPYSDINVKFYHMNALQTFDAVIGHDTLKELKAILDIPAEKLIIPNNNKNFKIPLLQHNFSQVNNIEIRTEHLDDSLKKQLTSFLKNYKDMFQPPDSKLTYTTNIKAKIRTTDN